MKRLWKPNLLWIMYKTKFYCLLALAGTLLLGGCRHHNAGGEARYTINLADALKERETFSFDISQLGSFEHVLSIDEETLPFSFHWFSSMDKKSILVADWDNAARVSLEDGSILARYAHQGRGPNEYTRITRCQFMDGQVYVRSSEKVIVCEPDGRAVREFAVNPTDELEMLPGGRFFRFYAAGFDEDRHLYDVLDEDGNVLRESSVVVPTVGRTAMIYTNGAQLFDGEWYSLPSHTETLWKISETTDQPWIEMKLGAYKMPSEYLSTVEGRRQVSDQYIDLSRWYLIGNYFFCQFKRGDYHCVIYDLKHDKLLFHAISPKLTGVGIPFEYEGETHHLWPVFTDEYHILFQGASQDDLWLFARK